MLAALNEIRRTMNLGGWLMTNATFLVAKIEVDPVAMARHLPFGLRLAKPATARLFVARFPETTWGTAYHEAGLFVDVRHHFRAAMHCPWILVDDDLALIYGRELLGYPKKIGAVDWQEEGDRLRVTVSRRGTQILAFDGTAGARDPEPPPLEARTTCNIAGSPFSLPRLVRFRAKEEILAARHAEVAYQIAPSPFDPLHELGLGRVLEAHLYRANLGGGRPPIPVGIASPLYWARTWALRYR
jgi:acetoacetate decarboxylase